MLELLCRGRPSLIEPLIFRLAMRLGLITAHGSRDRVANQRSLPAPAFGAAGSGGGRR